MLDHLKADIEVLDYSMKTVESNEYREMSEIDKVANSVLAAI